MDESQIKFGDKLFLYGQFLQYLPEFEEYEYNSVKGYMTWGNNTIPIETIDDTASISGFVTEILSVHSLATPTPFSMMEMVDVTQKLSRSLPLPSGTKIWMPIQARELPSTDFH